ncbi:hypothetical protein [Ferrovibrio sp.]|uniref:hypothetical protein n=1 Tax=Ferrovibrio sp. TaxID=1917215 RepID=UPI003D0BC56A
MTKPEVFIIESLKFDEEKNYREGRMIYRALRMSLKNPIYHYVRTATELQHFIDEFEDSEYRYLHISCHGSLHGVSTTLDNLSRKEFADIVAPALDRRRLFLSTCQAATASLAREIFSHGDCYSVAGPVNKINFDDSVVLWTSFYHLMFKADSKKMKRDVIKKTLGMCADLVDEKINFFAQMNGKFSHDRL